MDRLREEGLERDWKIITSRFSFINMFMTKFINLHNKASCPSHCESCYVNQFIKTEEAEKQRKLCTGFSFLLGYRQDKQQGGHADTNRAALPAVTVMSSALYLVLLFSALWTLSFCGTRQFLMVKIKKNWANAQNHCRDKYIDLATTESQEEMNDLIAVLNGNENNFWIGLKQKDEHDQSWIWSDGSKSSYRDWKTGEPNFGVGEMCVELRHDSAYKWNDAGCKRNKNQFVCYTNISTHPQEELPLLLINQNKTWGEALRYCRVNHVDLVSVHTEEIQHWVEAVTKTASTANVWMGLRHTCTLSFWFWVSGESMCYQNWAPGNGTGVEDCSGGERTGAVQSGSKQWVSLPEEQRLNFICTVEEF
ncbi:hypothetical protein SRHO_G00030340 [Serrasalmus rhombeus]